PTVVPSVVSLMLSPMATPSVNRLLTSGLPNSACWDAWKSTCSGCGFIVRHEKKMLSASVTVRPGWCWNTWATASSSNSLPAMMDSFGECSENARSAGRTMQDRRLDAARDEPAVGGTAVQLAALGDHLPAQQRHGRPPRHCPAFPRAVVAHVEVFAG